MENVNDLNKFKLDLLCMQLSKAIKNKEACDRYERQSHVANRLKVQEPSKYIDIRGIERYMR